MAAVRACESVGGELLEKAKEELAAERKRADAAKPVWARRKDAGVRLENLGQSEGAVKLATGSGHQQKWSVVGGWGS